MKDGQFSVYVALEKGPNDPVESFDYTDLTDRVRAFHDGRGRDDPLDPFQPGTATVTLWNGDRALDPSNPDGLLFNGSDPIGLPLCPVKITQWFDDVEYPKFTGYLGPEAWPGDLALKAPHGFVSLEVMDALGHSPGLPGDVWGLGVAGLHPDWWSRMDDFGLPVLDDGSEVPNSIGPGHGAIEGTTGISRPTADRANMDGLGIFDPALLLSGDHLVRFPAAGLMPDGDQDKTTVFLWWYPLDDIDSGDTADVLRFTDPSDGTKRLHIWVDGDDGHAYVKTYDAAGAEVDAAEIDPSPAGFSRFDTAGHMITVLWDSGTDNNCTVWFGGISATLNIPGDLYESDLLLGPSPMDVLFDELAVWRRALVYESEIAVLMMLGGYGNMWAGDTWHDRLGHYIEATGRTVTSDDTEAMHFPVSDVRGLWGLFHPSRPSADGEYGNYTATLPDNLAAAYQATVDQAGGARWATKEGTIRARSLAALTDPEWAEHYATPVLFTDANRALNPGEYRHAGPELTGLRIDRVVNHAARQVMHVPGGPPAFNTASILACTARDQTSIDRYGLRSDDQRSEWCDWVLNQQLVELIVDRYSQPHPEFTRIRLDPLNDPALAEWLITTCELELACSVEYTPFGSDPVLVEGLNIQRIEFDWTPGRWTVDLVVARS